jgi:hypothetical protein
MFGLPQRCLDPFNNHFTVATCLRSLYGGRHSQRSSYYISNLNTHFPILLDNYARGDISNLTSKVLPICGRSLDEKWGFSGFQSSRGPCIPSRHQTATKVGALLRRCSLLPGLCYFGNTFFVVAFRPIFSAEVQGESVFPS